MHRPPGRSFVSGWRTDARALTEFQQIGAEISAENRERLLNSLEHDKQLVRAKRSQKRGES